MQRALRTAMFHLSAVYLRQTNLSRRFAKKFVPLRLSITEENLIPFDSFYIPRRGTTMKAMRPDFVF